MNSTFKKVNFQELSEDSFSKENFMNFISSIMWELGSLHLQILQMMTHLDQLDIFLDQTKILQKYKIQDMLEKLDLNLMFK